MLSVIHQRHLSTFVGRVVLSTEDKLFTYLKMAYLNDLTMSSHEYESHDCTSAKAKLVIELKCRNIHYGDLLLEADKYKALVDAANALGYTPWYVNSTPQGVYAFNLSKIKVTWTIKRLPAHTHFSNGEYVSKTVTYLKITQAQRL